MALWTPAALGSDVKLWLKADALALSNGTAVSSWGDSSGSGNTATQGTGADQPIYRTNQINSLPAVDFVSTDFLVCNASSSQRAESVYAVVDLDNATDYRLIVGPSGNGGRQFYARLTDRRLTVAKQAAAELAVHSGAIAIDTPSVVGFTSTAGAFDLSLNGTVETVSDSTAYTGGLTTRIAQPSGAASQSWDGLIAELVVVQPGAAAADQRRLEGYLAWKYGVQASLPGGHPYKSAPPTVPGGITLICQVVG